MCRPIAQLVEHRSPKPGAGGSSPSWPAIFFGRKMSQGVSRKALDFIGDVKAELKKVTWPSRKETFASTQVVIIFVLLIALFLWGVDCLLSAAIQLFL